MLARLTAKAWHFHRLPSTPFTLELAKRDPDEMLRAIYEHARRRAPGLDVPFAVPRLRFTLPGMASTGSFSVSADGWTTIEVCLSLRGNLRALARVLAHEASHHILSSAGLAIRGDDRRNERLTELAMFVCGFGQLAIDGEMAMTAAGLRCDPALGYMDHRAMIAAEEAVCREISKLDANKVGETVERDLEAQARRMFNSPGQFDRMLTGYQRLAPQSSRSEILCRMVEDYHRDRR